MDKNNDINDQIGFRLLLQVMLATKTNGAAQSDLQQCCGCTACATTQTDKYGPGVTLNSNKETNLPTNMSHQPSQTPPRSTITPFPNAEDGTGCKRQIEDLIQQQGALEADGDITVLLRVTG
jgi:hypothetical protein